MKYIIKYSLFIILIFIVNTNLFSQNEKEDVQKLKVLFDKLYFANSDSIKEVVNGSILIELKDYLSQEADIHEELNEIKNLSLLKSDDEYIYILTWAVKFSDRNMQYYGFIKFYNRNRGEYYVEELIDKQGVTISNLNNKIFIEEWYGALYYKIISKKYKKDRHYILLGWDGNDDFTNKKIIDVLFLEDNEIPVLGKDIINYKDKIVSRLVFEYGERVSMNLKYEENEDMIIWDHLSPSKQELKGHFEYYGPDLTFDALFFEKGIWEYIPDVDLNK